MIHELQDKENRNAQFKTVIALILNGEENYFEGTVKGEITHQKQGTNGFGYDPIFKPAGYDKTFGELSEELKNNLSHREIATHKILAFLLRQKEE